MIDSRNGLTNHLCSNTFSGLAKMIKSYNVAKVRAKMQIKDTRSAKQVSSQCKTKGLSVLKIVHMKAPQILDHTRLVASKTTTPRQQKLI